MTSKTYKEAKRTLKPLGLETKDEYLEVAPDFMLPLNPEINYKDEWKGWDEYLTSLRSTGKQREMSNIDKKVNAWLCGHLPPPVTISYNQTNTHRLTVARDRSVRIKIAKGSSDEETNRIIEGFTNVANQALSLNVGSLRGAVKLNDKYNQIVLYTDSKKEHYGFCY